MSAPPHRGVERTESCVICGRPTALAPSRRFKKTCSPQCRDARNAIVTAAAKAAWQKRRGTVWTEKKKRDRRARELRRRTAELVLRELLGAPDALNP